MSSPMDLELARLHDARATYDAASLNFADYETQGRPSWIVATVAPGPSSGAGTIIDDAGKMTNRTGRGVIFKTGTWKVVTCSPSAERPVDGAYSWYEPDKSSNSPVPEVRYSPFTRGGSILFQPVAGQANRSQFWAVRVIFPDWAESVAPAFAFHEANPQLFDPDPQSAAVAQLMDLVGKPNPLLAVVAFRDLLALGLVPGDWVRAQLVGARGHVASVFAYLTIISAGPNAARPFANEAMEVIDTADETTIQFLVRGAYAAALFAPIDPANRGAEMGLFVRARQRLLATGATVDKDPLLAWVVLQSGG